MNLSPSTTRRAAANVRASASSAVVSVSTPGVLPTAMPCLVPALTSTCGPARIRARRVMAGDQGPHAVLITADPALTKLPHRLLAAEPVQTVKKLLALMRGHASQADNLLADHQTLFEEGLTAHIVVSYSVVAECCAASCLQSSKQLVPPILCITESMFTQALW